MDDIDSDSCMCIVCKKSPSEIDEYVFEAEEEGISPEEYVKKNEGTYNRTNGHFTCTSCYILIGMPSSKTGWKAP